MFLLAINAVTAGSSDVIITQVIYDSVEPKGEAVEIYNAGQQTVNVSGWLISTENRPTDATIPDDTLIAAGRYYLIADQGWGQAKDAAWPEANHEEAITLTNSDAGVALNNGTGIVDAVGWGDSTNINAGMYEGTPHDGVAQGKSLKRRTDGNGYVDTNNNSNDFIESDPSFSRTLDRSSTSNQNPTSESDQIRVVAVVSGAFPTIDTFRILTDDDDSTNGTQINPIPKRNKTVEVEAVVTHNSGNDYMDAVTLTFNGNDYNMTPTSITATSSSYKGSFNMSHDDAARSYELLVVATDKNNASVNATTNFEYTSLIAMEIDSETLTFAAMPGRTSEIAGDLDENTDTSMTIKNIGNSLLNIRLSGSNLSSSQGVIGVNNIRYTFNGNYSDSLAGDLSESAETKAVGVPIAGNKPVSFKLTVPTGTVPGNYTGTITLMAVGT